MLERVKMFNIDHHYFIFFKMGWAGGPITNNGGGPMTMPPPREIIRTKSCVLYPPPASMNALFLFCSYDWKYLK